MRVNGNQFIYQIQVETKRSKNCGIYKITSPSERVYIGQAVNIKRRWNNYNVLEQSIKQPKLHNSFKKHGIENHIFEIIEECDFEQLNIRERYWQDFYDVLNGGLNCVLTKTDILPTKISEDTRTKMSYGMIGSKNPNSRDIIDPYLGIYYESLAEASLIYSVNRNYLKDMLRGKAFNKTNLIYAQDYEKELLPSTLFSRKVYNRVKVSKEGCEVVDYTTKEIVGSVIQVANSIGIKEGAMRSYLTGKANNPTNFIYKKDFDRGLSPKSLCSNVVQKVKIIDFITFKIFNTMKEASEYYGVGVIVIKKCLRDEEKSFLPIVKLEGFDENNQYVYSPDNIRNNTILDLESNKRFSSIVELSKYSGLPKDKLSKILQFKRYNDMSIIYERDYNKGLLPNSNYKGKGKKCFEVVDIKTNIEYKSIRDACRQLNMCNKKVSTKLKNEDFENLTLRYKNGIK